MRQYIQSWRWQVGMFRTVLLCIGLSPTWEAQAAGYQMPITFGGYTNRSEALTNFPVLVVLSNGVGNGFSFSNTPFVSAEGWDLRFVASSDDSESLNYEIERWNADGPCYVWVQVPTVPGDGTGALWAKWGDSDDADRLACTTNGATWTNGYDLVEHLSGTSGISVADSTVSNRAATIGDTYAWSSAGAMGGALQLSADNSRIVLGSGVPLGGAYTISAWYKGLRGTGYRTLCRGATATPDGDHPVIIDTGANNLGVFGNAAGGGFVDSGCDLTPDAPQQWRFIMAVASGGPGGATAMYTNGVYAGTSPKKSSRDVYAIGNYQSGNQRWSDYLDEFRVERVARSSNWVWACYLNQAMNGAFNRYGSVEAVGSPPGAPKIANYAVQDVVTNSATLVGYLSLGDAPVKVLCYWGPNDGLNVSDNWATNTSMGESNAAPAYLTNSLTDLTPNTPYFYRYYATNAAGEHWGTGIRAFTTLGAPTANNDAGATNVTAVSAVLRGMVTAGTPAPDVVICLKKTSAGSAGSPADTGTWDRVIGLGAQSGSFSNTVTGLDPASTYYYQCLATNSTAAVWAPTAARFDTLSFQPFNLASNHLVNGGATLYATNPAVTLPATAGWLYDFASIGCTNLNMGAYRISTDNGDGFTLNLGGGPIVNGGDLKTSGNITGPSGSITITNAGNISVGTIMSDNSHGVFDNAGSVTVRQTGGFSAAQISTVCVNGNAGAQNFRGDGSGPFVVTSGGMKTHTTTYNACGALTINDYSSVTVTGGVRTGPVSGNINIGVGAVAIGQSTNRIGGAVTISGGIVAENTGGSSASALIYATGDVTLSGGGISTRAGYGSGQGLTVDTTGGSISIGGDLLAGSSAANQNGGSITLSAGGDITVSGAVNSDATSAANEGDVTLSATNGITDLAALDTNTMKTARLFPLKYSYIQTLTGAPGASLRTDAGRKVFYGGGGTNIVQLRNLGDTGAGGVLTPGFGNMAADNGNDAGTFGPQLSATVRDASFNVGYDGLRGRVTNAAGSLGTVATILHGSASATPTAMTMAWRTRTTAETNRLVSDVVSLGGTAADPYVLRMNYSEAAVAALNRGTDAELAAAGDLRLQRYGGSAWVRVGAGSNQGAYTNQATVGNWGVDTTANTAWAVVSEAGVFAVGGRSSSAGTALFLN